MNALLVACFSATGTTARVAHALAQAAQADYFAIEPAVPYTRADLDWHDKGSRSSREMDDPASRPAIAGAVEDMTRYSAVFLGFPIWWYQAPRIIETFAQSCDLDGKPVACFATSGGSGMGRTVEILKGVRPGAKWLPGRRFGAEASGRELADWARSLGLLKA